MRIQNTADRLDEIMILADTHAYARVKDGTPRAQLPYTHLKNAVQAVLAENEALRTELAAARQEIENLQAQAQQCGAGAGCCAQAARIAELEAIGAGGVGALVGALEIAEAALADIGDADREPWDDVAWCEARAAQALPEVRAALITAAPQQAAQDALAYQAACSLATRLFKKHFSKNVEYASGKVTWGLCDTTVGVISQIVNMVFWLVEPAAQAQPDDQQARGTDAAKPAAQAQAALVIAEAALADIGDADHEPNDDLAWCEARAALSKQ